jgi:signal recognition particle receptor subunit beta
MVSINYSSREVCCKIVYYGPGLSGKTTNLLYVHSKVPSDTRGKMISLATEADRTLYFDFLPINIGHINGFAAKFQLYTVPGQVYYNATRKLVLRGVDGVVFVADSQPDKMEENIESLVNLEENLREYGYDVDELPMVIQYNKRDLPGVLPIETLNERLNTRGLPHFGASATVGNGVFDTLKLIIKLVLEKAKSSASDRPQQAVKFTEQPATEQPAAEQPAAESAVPSEPEQPEPASEPVDAVAPQADEQPPVEEVQSATEDDTGRLPGRSTQPIEVGAGAPAAQAEPVQPEPASYRPYPGSNDSPEGFDKKVSSANFSPSRTAEADDAVAVSGKIHSGADDDVDLSRPAMAPSLKKRGDKKKRGFFKRLFGIK